MAASDRSPRAAIVGAALSEVGRVDDVSAFELHHQAAARALADAGIAHTEVDGFASVGAGLLQPIEVAEHLGLRPTWVDSTAVGGATWEVMLEHAVAAIHAGHASVVLLVYGSTARADIKRRLRTGDLALSSSGPTQYEVPYGHTLIAKHAMVTRRHMHEHGTTLEQLAEVAVQARANAARNPDAMYRDPLTVEEVNAAPLIADPLTKLHCCIRSDGGGAVVVVGADRARDLAADPVWVLGTGTAISHTSMSQMPDLTRLPAERSGALAFGRAGLTPHDVDLCQVYDAFTIVVPMTFEALGFCAPGEGGAFVSGGRLLRDGALPTNTDGGGLSACHPGMRGIFLLVEAVAQLRGSAGERQVPGTPKVALAHGTGGWLSSAATVLLGADHAFG